MKVEVKKIITIPRDPVSAHRPRFSRKLGRAYDSQREVRDNMTWHVASQWTENPVEGAVSIDVEFMMKIPKSTSKKRTALMLGTPCLKKWDLDNGLKILLDSMNGVVFNDDGQVYNLHACKLWSEEPRTIVTIETTEI